MSLITKLKTGSLGEVTVRFSLRSGLFELEFQKEVDLSKVVTRNLNLRTWDDVISEIKNMEEQNLFNSYFVRKLIFIKLKTSESPDTEIIKTAIGEKKVDEKLVSGVGFELEWFIVEEFQMPDNKFHYRTIEKCANGSWRLGDRNIIQQHHHLSNCRVIEYRADMHSFLKDMDIRVAGFLKEFLKFFDKDENKFVANITNTDKFKLLQ